MNLEKLISVSFGTPTHKREFIKLFDENKDACLALLGKTKLLEEAKAVIQHCQKKGIQILTMFDTSYPPALLQIEDRPLLLYAKGDLSTLRSNANIAVVGTRQPTEYGKLTAYNFSKDMATMGVTIVSGLAEGIDSEAHKGAIAGEGKTIAVLGNGIDIIYPASNRNLYNSIIKDYGVIISEYKPWQKGERYTFPERNRIIAGLSKGIVVIESKERGGSLITADLGLQYNREVFAVPGRVTDTNSQGTNLLIQKGAKLINSVSDIFEELNWQVPEQAEPQSKPDISSLSKEELQIYEVLSYEPLHLDIIINKTDLLAQDVIRYLSLLELNNFSKELPGKKYIRG